MPLAMEGTRVLSPLERDAVKLVFKDAIDPWDISLTVVESLEIELERHALLDINKRVGNQFRPLSSIQPQEIIDRIKQPPPIEQQLPPIERQPATFNQSVQAASTYDGDGKIRISRSAFPHTDALNINSTRADTTIFKPANMHYLSTLIHECTHYWQEVYGRHTFYKNFYDFTRYQLLKRDVPELSANQHASAVQIYFLIEWQLAHRPKGSDVNLTRLIHECTHYWQEVYGRHTFYKNFYDFTRYQLLKRDVPELSANQHASAVQIYFLIEWQLAHRPKGSDVNLTSRSPNPEHNVGPVDRFRNIDMRIHNSGKGTSRIVKYQHARESIHNYFSWLLVELRYGWKAVCQGKESFTKNKRQAWVPTWA